MTGMDARRLGLTAALCALSGLAIALPAQAQIDRCQMHAALGRSLPAACGGTGTDGTQTRGRVVIGQPDSGAAKPPAAAQPGAAALAPRGAAPAAAPAVDRA